MSGKRAEGAYPVGAFQVLNTLGIRHTDVRGREASVALFSDGSVEIVGKEGGVLRLTMFDVERLRIGFAEQRPRRVYSATVWHTDGRAPIELIADLRQWGAYRTFIHRWAALLATNHRLDRIEVGSSKFQAVFLPAAFFPLMVGALLVSIFVLRNEPWWGRVIVSLLPIALFVLCLRLSITRLWPRPATTPADLDRYLPPG